MNDSTIPTINTLRLPTDNIRKVTFICPPKVRRYKDAISTKPLHLTLHTSLAFLPSTSMIHPTSWHEPARYRRNVRAMKITSRRRNAEIVSQSCLMRVYDGQPSKRTNEELRASHESTQNASYVVVYLTGLSIYASASGWTGNFGTLIGHGAVDSLTKCFEASKRTTERGTMSYTKEEGRYCINRTLAFRLG
ncbi:hypothetical protein K440DRAFT_290423 [Wilcoxina mikolae CBS 423.85]|nr:hypothetical protein K440DRAFT_290423 [Wilcoxina mikolae CBS 423.85]